MNWLLAVSVGDGLQKRLVSVVMLICACRSDRPCRLSSVDVSVSVGVSVHVNRVASVHESVSVRDHFWTGNHAASCDLSENSLAACCCAHAWMSPFSCR